MDDDLTWIILVGLLVLVLPVMTIAAFVMALRLRTRVALLERRVATMTGEGATALLRPDAPISLADDPEPAPAPDVAAPTPPQDLVPPLDEPAAADPAMQAPAIPVRRRESFEEKLGARWAVWVGGLALAFGGVFLVRYSIEAGLLGPAARTVLGLLFAAGLLASGEWLRRRQPIALDQGRSAYIPGVVTAAGTAVLFASVYAAYALYGFIGPALAFPILGAVGVATMAAAALHGPWLAGLGLLGAYGTPLLVSSNEPSPWALVLFLVVVTACALVLARLRRWRWLAASATIAALGWGFVAAVIFQGDAVPVATYVLALGALVFGLLAIEPHRGPVDHEGFDPLAIAATAGVAALALWFALSEDFSHIGLLVPLLVAAGLLAIALRFDADSPAAGTAALLGLGVLLLWPVARQAAAEPMTVVPDLYVVQAVTPDALRLYLVVAIAFAAALLLATTASLMRRPAMARAPAVALALAGTAGPLLLFACTYVRTTGFTSNVPFGMAGLLSAAGLAWTTRLFLEREREAGSDHHGIAASIHAAAATAALALALATMLEGSGLTLAFALAALGTAWVSTRRPLAALRWSAAAMAVLVVLRIGGPWTLVGEALTTFPDFADIALRYALPCLAIGLAGWMLRRQRVDTPAAMLDAAAILLGTAAAGLSIRLLVAGPERALGADMVLSEAGLYAALVFAMAIGFTRSALTTTSIIHRAAAPLAAIAGVLLAVRGPMVFVNPFVTGDTVQGGLVINSLLLGFAVPALLAAIVSRMWNRLADLRRQDPAGYRSAYGLSFAGPIANAAGATALVLAFQYATLETRVLVSGPDMSFNSIPTAESYAYSAVWLLFGIALLAGGLVFSAKAARLASAMVIMLTVAKVFLLDMSDLEGVWRALSFIGLGIVLIGMGLVYQRLLFTRKPGENPFPPA